MFEKEKADVVRIAQKMYHSGMTNMFEGNVSVRSGNTILLTPSQQDKDTLTIEKIIEMDMDGRVKNPECGLKPSVEYRMHAKLYSLRPDIRAVVHNHSAYATAFAMAGREIVSDAHLELNLLFGKIPVVPYGMLGTEDIYRGIEPLVSDYNAFLLENHGVLAVGPDATTAFSRIEAVEKIAKTLILTQWVGGEKSLPAEELVRVRLQGQQNRHKEMGK